MSKKISEMVSASALTGTDVVPIVTAGLDNQKVTGNQIKSFCTAELNDTQGVVFVHDSNATTVSMSGVLSDVGDWIKTNYITNKWLCVKVTPTNSTGYFGGSSFTVMANCSSANYGSAYLTCDNPNKSAMVLGQLVNGSWSWKAVSTTNIS